MITLFTREPFLLRSRDNFAIAQEACDTIVVESRNPDDVLRHRVLYPGSLTDLSDCMIFVELNGAVIAFPKFSFEYFATNRAKASQ